MKNKPIDRYCYLCGELVMCKHEDAIEEEGILTQEDSYCDCTVKKTGIVFHSLLTSVEQDCLVKGIERILKTMVH